MPHKNHKIKIDKTDMEKFPYESLVVEPYWNDLYNPQNRRA